MSASLTLELPGRGTSVNASPSATDTRKRGNSIFDAVMYRRKRRKSHKYAKHPFLWVNKKTISRSDLALACFAEYLAMAFFVFIGTGSALSTGEFLSVDGGSGAVARIMPIAMAFGMSIMVLVYSIGDVSEGHINPAVSFFLFLTGESSLVKCLLYTICHLAGAVTGSAFLYACTSGLNKSRAGNPPFDLGANSLNPDLTEGNGFCFEMIGTCLLCLVVFLTAVRDGNPTDGKPNLAPLVIGFTVFLAHVVLIPFTGCGINPARTFGPALVNSFVGNNVWGYFYWIYFIGPFAGALLARLIISVFPRAIDIKTVDDSNYMGREVPDPDSGKNTPVTRGGRADSTIAMPHDIMPHEHPNEPAAVIGTFHPMMVSSSESDAAISTFIISQEPIHAEDNRNSSSNDDDIGADDKSTTKSVTFNSIPNTEPHSDDNAI